MALSFTPKHHVEAAPRVWHQLLNTLAPFGRYPSLEEIKLVSDESLAIESQGEKVIKVVFDPNGVVNLNTSSIKNMKAVLQFTALALSLTLLVVSLWAYTFPKTGNFPSLIVLGAVGWLAFSISLSTCKSSQNS